MPATKDLRDTCVECVAHGVAEATSRTGRRCEMLTDHPLELLMLSVSLMTAMVVLFGFGGEL